MARLQQPFGKNDIPFFILLAVSLVIATIIRGQYLDYYNHLELSPTTLTLKKDKSVEVIPAPTSSPIMSPPSTTPPTSVLLLNIPFTTQAPLALWDPLHEEACEEASLLMVYYYRTGQKFASPLEADAEIKKLVAWEENKNYEVSVTVTQLSKIARDYLKLNTGRVLINPTVEQLKVELAAGRPVIVPAAGQELKNPYFTPPGPIYHMLVLKGYDKTGFIVNDPGTRRGESYRYTFDRIMTAMHDWNSVNILQGQKVVVVFD